MVAGTSLIPENHQQIADVKIAIKRAVERANNFGICQILAVNLVLTLRAFLAFFAVLALVIYTLSKKLNG